MAVTVLACGPREREAAKPMIPPPCFAVSAGQALAGRYLSLRLFPVRLSQQAFFGKQPAGIGDAHRPAIEIALAFRTAERAQPLLDRAVFDALGGDRQVQAVTEPRDRIHDRCALGVLVDRHDEALVDL